MWILLFWLLSSFYAQEIEQQYFPSANLAERKCLHAPGSSYFDEESETCFVRTKLDCSMVRFHTTLVRQEMSEKVTREMRRKGIFREGETQNTIPENICAFREYNVCGEFKQNGRNCYSFGNEETSWTEAKDACDCDSQLFVPHRDEDIRNALDVMPSSDEQSSYWLGTHREHEGWANSDGSHADFFRWAAENNYNPEEFVAVSLNTDEKGSYGYTMADPTSTGHQYICHRPAKSIYRAEKQTEDE